LNKARRGELQCPLPVGLVYNSEGRPILDPDQQVQQSLRFLFDAFRRTGSACAVVKAFRQKKLLFPRRLRTGPNQGELVWAELAHSRALYILHNPRYAGAFVYGRNRTRRKVDGRTSYTKAPREQWILLPDVHPGYLSWDSMKKTGNDSRRMLTPTARIVEGVHPRRASVVAGLGGLRRLWQPDDRPVSHAPDQDRARVCVPA